MPQKRPLSKNSACVVNELQNGLPLPVGIGSITNYPNAPFLSNEELKEKQPALIRAAAQAIANAGVFVIASGAGFSADSGLAVYKDIADVPAYQKRGLEYHDICQPHWIEEDPDLFYGFWGMCFNDYRNTNPHEGYHIIQRWRDSRFAKNKYSQQIQSAWKGKAGEEAPGAFFSVTSNVDEHFKKVGFKPSEVREIHGHTE
eukprot:1969673-Pyramimonas_sp.AAC.2